MDEKTSGIRLKIFSVILLLVFLALVARLFYWQIFKGKALSLEAKNQHAMNTLLNAPRGNILAGDGTWLAARKEAYLIYAEIPNLKESPRDIANKLAPLLIEDPSDKESLLNEAVRLEGLLSKKEIVWVPLKQKISQDTKNNISALKIDGVGFEADEAREYPEGSSSAHLLGFVGKKEDGSDIGYFGLEGFYNMTLTGKPGFSELEKDAMGNPIAVGKAKEVSAVGGIDLVTNIDKTIQMSIEKRLAEGIAKYGASSGTVIVENPKTGAILAMASYPSYDPATYWKFGDEYFKNPAISSTFEPGSVFKVVIMASALDMGAVEPETICDICDKPFKVDKYFIETWNNKYHPNSTMTDVIVNSDNVGMSFVSQKMGADALYDYLAKFGIGKLTGVDLQGEIAPELRQKGTWNVVDLATASFGQGVAITPIELIKAVSTIANGGVEVTPQVVKSLQGTGWEQKNELKIGKRIISETAAKEMTAMMVEAAKNGESKWTNLKGFKVAGKTGTAQIPIAGHYDVEKTMASFVGFAPADSPKFVMLVILKEPKSSIWASETAAPLWYAIAKDIFPYLGIQPEN